jgi:hypothetical protein
VNDKQIVLDGHFVSERVSQVVEAIRQYSPEIEVQWIPPEARDPFTAAFRIMHNPPGGKPYVIFHVKTEDEFDARVLKRIIMGDQRNGKITLSEVEAAEQAAKMVAMQRAHDEMLEDIDKMYHVLKSPLNTYKLDKDTTFKDGIPFNTKK